MNRFLYLPLLFPCIFRPSHKFNTVKKSLYLLAISLHILPTIEDTSYRHCKMLFHVSFPCFYQYRYFFSFTFCSSEYIYFFHTHHPHFLTSILFSSLHDLTAISISLKISAKGRIIRFHFRTFNHLSKLILTTHASIFPFLSPSTENHISRNPSIYKL